MPSAAEGCRHLHPRACQAFVRYSSALSRRVTHYLPLHRKPSTLTSSFVTSARHRIINYPVFSPFGAIVGKLGLNPAIWKFPSTFKSLFSAFPHLTDFWFHVKGQRSEIECVRLYFRFIKISWREGQKMRLGRTSCHAPYIELVTHIPIFPHLSRLSCHRLFVTRTQNAYL